MFGWRFGTFLEYCDSLNIIDSSWSIDNHEKRFGEQNLWSPPPSTDTSKRRGWTKT